MKIVPITDELLPELHVFCDKAKELGYQNNISPKAMKYDWCKEQGEYFCAIVGPNAWRIMFRGCELPHNDSFKGLGKGDWNSITQREMIPKFIEWIPSDEIYITTNIDHEHSNGKASRNHRLMGLLAKQGILDKHSDIMLYYTLQTVWRLNILEYTTRRNRLRGKYVL